MRVGVLAEMASGECRVALSPVGVEKLVGAGHEVFVESGAGDASGFNDEAYKAVGATVTDRDSAIGTGGVLLQVRISGTHDADDNVRAHLTSDHVLIGLADPLWQATNMADLASTGAQILSLELVPRITRAQSMDVLSAMATVAGYEAVLLAAASAPKMFPMLMTAAGTVPPTRVVVLGAGVAGLQAIATAKRLGAVVEAYDVRPAAAEQIESLGAKAIRLEVDTGDSEDAGGYAKAQSEDQADQQKRLLAPHLANADVVITTAAIPGRASPELVTAEMVEAMKSGSVIIDLAAERGGNCELTEAGETVVHDGVEIHGPTDLESHSPRTASRMMSNNICTLLDHLDNEGELVLDREDEITSAMLVTAGGDVVHPRVQEALEAGS